MAVSRMPENESNSVCVQVYLKTRLVSPFSAGLDIPPAMSEFLEQKSTVLSTGRARMRAHARVAICTDSEAAYFGDDTYTVLHNY